MITRTFVPSLPASVFLAISIIASHAHGQTPLRDQAKQVMDRATRYYVDNVARHGGYVYHYTLDLETRWGEGLAQRDEIWVQPPGTPTVGLALLAAHRATGESMYLNAAQRAAEALAYGQLRGGGWTNKVNLANRDRGPFEGGRRRRDGNSSLDDGQTQTALRFMIEMDEALKFQHAAIHESAKMGVQALLKVQFPNGAFPQVWKGVERESEPNASLQANYPKHDWRTEGRVKNYWDMYTLNDNICGYVVETLMEAHRVYKSEACLQAVKRLGDFLIRAQMPEPQPAWAQQYNYQMQPIWARRFEPPGVSGDESQEAIETLLRIHRITRDDKYLAPIPKALDYLEKSTLPDGQLARYYELQTNKPLYMTRNGKQYTLTYSDKNLPKHYGWKTPSRVDQLRQQYEQQRRGVTADQQPQVDEATVRRIVGELDDQARWVTLYDGVRLVGQPKFQLQQPYLSSQRFSDNLETLAAFLEQTAAK